ncbi:MAG TPA: hypothetical protein VL793_04450 [Patescibacteria group bacterium]|nr:hypothetical protein [Patescibacteria group bacterium]
MADWFLQTKAPEDLLKQICGVLRLCCLAGCESFMNVTKGQYAEAPNPHPGPNAELSERNGVYYAQVHLFSEAIPTEIALTGTTTIAQAQQCLKILQAGADWTKRPRQRVRVDLVG